MMRRERLEKILNILSLILPQDTIMAMTPEELEEKFYKIITEDKQITKLYLEYLYDKKGNKTVDNTISKTEKV